MGRIDLPTYQEIFQVILVGIYTIEMYKLTKLFVFYRSSSAVSNSKMVIAVMQLSKWISILILIF